MTISGIDILLSEQDSSWFLNNYGDLREDSYIKQIIQNLDDTKTSSFMYMEQAHIKPIKESIINFKESIIEFNSSSSELEIFLKNIYTSFSLLKEEISGFSFKVDEIKVDFISIQNKVDRMKKLKNKLYFILTRTVIDPNYLRKITESIIDSSYTSYLDYIKEKLKNIGQFCIENTKMETELSSTCNALFSIAYNRICREFYLLFSQKKFHLKGHFLHYQNSKLHSELLEKSILLNYLDPYLKEYKYLRQIYSELIFSELMTFVFKHIQESFNKKEKEINLPIISNDYDKYYLVLYEREQILNKIYLDTDRCMEEIFNSLPENNCRLEESLYFSQRIIYRSFLQIYELSKQLFPTNLKKLLFDIFNIYFNKILDLTQTLILKSNDIIGLSISFNMLIKFKILASSKIKFYNFGIEDCDVLFNYYLKQIENIYLSLERSTIYHLNSLSSFNGRDFIRPYTSDKVFYLNPATRRISELLLLTIKLTEDLDNIQKKKIEKLVFKIQQFLVKWIKHTSNYLNQDSSGFEESCIYVINNVDVVLSTLQQKNFFADIFHHMLQEYTQKYIESRFRNIYSEINSVLESDCMLSENFDQEGILQIAEKFRKSWKKDLNFELQCTLRSFYNFDTSEEILKLLGTTIAMKYSQFIYTLHRENGNKQDMKVKEVSTAEILEYIQKCLYP